MEISLQSPLALLLLLAFGQAFGVEINNVTLVKVLSASSVLIESRAGEASIPVKINLLWINAPSKADPVTEGFPQAAASELETYFQGVTHVKLIFPGGVLHNKEGELYAIVIKTGDHDEISSNAFMILGGWSVFRIDHLEPESNMADEYTALQLTSQANNSGLWKLSRDWMADQLRVSGQPEGASSADIRAIANEALNNAVREGKTSNESLLQYVDQAVLRLRRQDIREKVIEEVNILKKKRGR